MRFQLFPNVLRVCAAAGLLLSPFAFGADAGMQAASSTPLSPYRDGWIDYNKNGRLDIYEDSKRPVDERVADLLSQMTFEEKLAQLRSTHGNNPAAARDRLLGMMVDSAVNRDVEQSVRVIDDLQHHVIEKTRLGTPLLFVDEALHGLRVPQATSFPQAIALSATWDTALMERVTTAIAAETKSRGIRQVLSPVVDIGRDSRWGRTEETYGEDPYLVSRMTVAFCKPLEDRGVITTPKHFVANCGDGGRDSWAQFIDERLLNEVYFPPYVAAIREAGSRSIMPAYGSINGFPANASADLLTRKARGEWGFRGYFGSDYSGVTGVKERHYLSDKDPEIAALCVNAGLDVEWPTARFYGKPLDEAIASGLVKKETIEAMAARLLRLKFEIGIFESPFSDPAEARRVAECPEHQAIALEAARKSMVLLKNERATLPLDPARIKKLAVIGGIAREAHLGGYSGKPTKTVSLLEGLRARLPGAEVMFHGGVGGSATEFMSLPGELFNDGRGFAYEVWENTGRTGSPARSGGFEQSVKRSRWLLTSQDKVNPAAVSARWTGRFSPTADMAARLQVQATGKMTVALNGAVVLANDGSIGERDRSFDAALGELPGHADLGKPLWRSPFVFKAGQTYDIEVLWSSADADPAASFDWDQRPFLERNIAAAVELARAADAVILCPGGLNEGEFRDRPDLDYPPEEERLIQEIAKTGRPVVVVLINGAAVTIADWERHVPAILETWFAGQAQGTAIAETLFGDNNPGGKLTLTFPQFSWQVPLYYNYHPIGRSRGFQDPLKGRPQYPFGYGLSYTTFAYSNLKLSRTTVRIGEGLDVTFDVKNTGSRAGDEVVQLYLHDELASVVRPVKELKGFARVALAPGETKTVTLKLRPEDLSFWDRDMKFTMEPGWTTLMIGASSEDIRQKTRFEIVK